MALVFRKTSKNIQRGEMDDLLVVVYNTVHLSARFLSCPHTRIITKYMRLIVLYRSWTVYGYPLFSIESETSTPTALKRKYFVEQLPRPLLHS